MATVHAIVAACALALVAWPGSGAAPATAGGTITGRVELATPPPDATPRPNVSALGMPDAHGPTDRRRSVVYLDPAPRAAFDVRVEPRARMDQRNESFVPHVLAIVAGTTVELMNYPQASLAPAQTEERLGYRMMALEVEDMKRALEHLKAKGIEPSWGPKFRPAYARAEIRDPDGNGIELRQWLQAQP